MLQFAYPMILGNLLQQCYNIADSFIVGKFLGSGALAAVGSAYSLMTFIISVIIGLCTYGHFFGYKSAACIYSFACACNRRGGNMVGNTYRVVPCRPYGDTVSQKIKGENLIFILLLPQFTIEFSACPAAEIRRQKALKYPHIPAAFFLVFRQRFFA